MKNWSAPNPLGPLGNEPPQDFSAHSDGRASWYAQGVSDALGDRLLMFDNSGGPALELLRFSWKLTAAEGFENALRERVELLSQFRHASFAKVRAVERLEPKNDLTLVSNHLSGKPLSDELAALRGPAFAMWVLRELVPALASLHQHAPGVAHGALTADRVVLTPEGRLVIVEHVLGSALERLQLSSTELWLRFGIPAVRNDTATKLDPATDVFQLALVALSVLLGRRIARYEYPDRFQDLLAEFQQTSGRELPSSLRVWLMRALHLEGPPFESARDAQTGLGELEAAAPMGLLSPLEVETPLPPIERDLRSTSEAEPLRHLSIRPEGNPDTRRRSTRETNGTSKYNDAIPAAGSPSSQRGVLAADLLNEHRPDLGWRHDHPEARWRGWALAAVTTLAVLQAVYIGYLLSAQPLALTIQAPPAPEPSAANRNLDAGLTVWQAMSAPLPAAAQDTQPAALNAAAPVVRSGGVRLVSRIEMQLLDGERVLGSTTDGPIVTSAGRHEFELVNSALGYRAKQVFNIRPGEIQSVSIPQPEGKMSINAIPWADVWIDGAHIGETPLANLSIPIGQHEVSFRHPSFGEQRRTTIVRYDVPTRLSADLR